MRHKDLTAGAPLMKRCIGKLNELSCLPHDPGLKLKTMCFTLDVAQKATHLSTWVCTFVLMSLNSSTNLSLAMVGSSWHNTHSTFLMKASRSCSSRLMGMGQHIVSLVKTRSLIHDLQRCLHWLDSTLMRAASLKLNNDTMSLKVSRGRW